MNRRTKKTRAVPEDSTGTDIPGSAEDRFQWTGTDNALLDAMGEYIRASRDLSEIQNDPSLMTTREEVKSLIADYNSKVSVSKENETFIKEAFSSLSREDLLSKEISFIKQEINEKNLDLVTADWVREWHEKKQKAGVVDSKTEEIRNFITSSLDEPAAEAQAEAVKELTAATGRKNARIIVLRTSVAAAAVIALFLVMRSFLLPADAGKLFTSYYAPYAAVSPVTRGASEQLTIDYAAAVNQYKNGDFAGARDSFRSLLQKNPRFATASFFIGLSELGAGNYGESVRILSDKTSLPAEFSKDASWYLGLSYLKLDDRANARKCFETLAGSEGYYHDRALKMLRRLK